MRIAITGHRLLPAETEALIAGALRDALGKPTEPATGISCLADGADALFAQAILDHGGTLIAVVPAAEYRAGLPEEHHAAYDRLLAAARNVHRLAFTASTSEAHMAASEFMIRQADEVWAVWDGQPARGFGGTADVVAAARRSGLTVRVIWPDGASRD
ncbi:hypothetical protein [Thermomonospora umbrina]|uniref:DNA recombination-mediator protein A n=1 Tax=Thermomonospora umbrina TaxID=111806 RepID=A0A3D9T428_9ACTN|nr:hypothetical protein [Thermomonospora umbrina]REE99454.1 hypothetical protein DFJ69_4967 [Thermomonospora umbrina]